VAEVPKGYKVVSEEDQRKAKVFFDRGKSVADTGNYDYAISMYLEGLNIDPDSVDAHQALRDISLKRKAGGAKGGLGFMEAMRLKRPTKDDKQNMLNAARLLAYDPGNTDHMVSILQNAYRAGYYDTVLWMGPILFRANADVKNPDGGKFIILKDVYKGLERWRMAAEAAQAAQAVRPNDMELGTEVKNLGALETMHQGGYASASSFRQSVRDMAGQQKLMDADKDIRSEDSLQRAVREAEQEWQADPDEPGKLVKLVDALEKTESPDHENRALELLEEAYKKTGQFRFRQRAGRIKMSQWRRMERSQRSEASAHPDDKDLQQSYEQFRVERLEFELKEYMLWSENYPTDMALRFEMAKRMFELQRYDQAIPVLQHARQDPKLRFEAAMLLGRSFLEAGFGHEAVETFQGAIDEYQLRGSDLAKELNYWQARALEQQGDRDTATKRYSQVAQWDFNYRDVQARIKRLRSGG